MRWKTLIIEILDLGRDKVTGEMIKGDDIMRLFFF